MKGSLRFSLLVVLVFGTISEVWAESTVYFSDDFEGGLGASAESVLDWQDPFSKDNEFGMMFGKGDIYSISNAISHSGAQSLRLNFDGRNGFCNTCGVDTFYVGENVNEQTRLISQSEGIIANQPDNRRSVFNKDDSWAKWTPKAVENGELVFEGDAPTLNDMGGVGVFNGGDEVKVARVCGVDGTIGGNIERRSDCNLAINYLTGLSNLNFDYGSKLSRRMYIYVPEDTVLPDATLKLGYSWFKNGDSRYAVYALISGNRGEKLEVGTRNLTGGQTFTGITVERDVWYYLEEVYSRETSLGASDGSYSLYFYKSNQAQSIPTVHYEGLTFGELNKISVVGNWQHYSDSLGSLFIDDVVIAEGYIGPVLGDGKQFSPPEAPSLEVE